MAHPETETLAGPQPYWAATSPTRRAVLVRTSASETSAVYGVITRQTAGKSAVAAGRSSVEVVPPDRSAITGVRAPSIAERSCYLLPMGSKRRSVWALAAASPQAATPSLLNAELAQRPAGRTVGQHRQPAPPASWARTRLPRPRSWSRSSPAEPSRGSATAGRGSSGCRASWLHRSGRCWSWSPTPCRQWCR